MSVASARQAKIQPATAMQAEGRGRYELNLAEFPLFNLAKRPSAKDPSTKILTYCDQITGKDGQPVDREWKLIAGLQVGGPSAQETLWDLIQIWKEQEFQNKKILFGSISALLRRRGYRNPSASDYRRVERDLKILASYTVDCKNAFWDNQKKAYVSIVWHLFERVVTFHEDPNGQGVLPIGYIELSDTFFELAGKGNFFWVEFDSAFYHLLTPLEQRFATYLSKMLRFHPIHRRDLTELAMQLPIQAKRADNVKKIAKRAMDGLIKKAEKLGCRLEYLPVRYEFYKGADKALKIAFFSTRAAESKALSGKTAETSATEYLLEEILKETGDTQARAWWIRCIGALGDGPTTRGLGLLREYCETHQVENKGAVLTKIFKDIAEEAGISISTKG